MADNEFKYLAFLSYSHQDNRESGAETQEAGRRCWGDWLHAALKSFSIPAEFVGQINGRGEIIPERMEPIFQDESELPADAGLSAEIRQALEQSICLIVIGSPRSASSRQVNEVVRYFKQLGRGKNILPIVVAGEPNASDGDKPGRSVADECFVPALRHPVRPDGTMETARRAVRHIFVDARHGVDKREILVNDHRNAAADLEMAKIQLIALLLSVGFNGLWEREQKRHFIDLATAQQHAREALDQVEETRRQLQEAQRQTREAQHQALEAQNLPRDVHHQIQAAQNQALEAQNQAHEAQKQLQEFQNKVRETLAQLEEARNRVLADESKVLAAQNQAREAQNQLEAIRNQAREAQNHQSQLEENRDQAQQEAQNKFLAAQSQAEAFQSQARAAQSQLEEARNQILAAQGEVLAAQQQARVAQDRFQDIQNQTRDAQGQIEAARNQVQQIQNEGRNARRLTKVFALLAVLGLLSASLAASMAWRQHQLASQTVAGTAAGATDRFDLATGGLDQERIRQVLQNIGGAQQARSLDQLAAGIPTKDIPEALTASAVLLNDQQRSHFQKWLLIRLGWVNPLSAMTNANTVDGVIVNDEGLSDSSSYFQLAVLDNWMKTDLSGAFSWAGQLPDADSRQRALEKIIPAMAADNPTNTLARLNDLQPAPDESIYQLLFQRWAAADPVPAIQQLQQLPDHDQDDTILCAIITVWMGQQPEAALNWVQAQPDSKSKNAALATCIDELAKTDVPRALALAGSLPEGDWRNMVLAGLSIDMNASESPDGAPEIMQPLSVPLPWEKFLPTSSLSGPTIFPIEMEKVPDPTNGSIPIKP